MVAKMVATKLVAQMFPLELYFYISITFWSIHFSGQNFPGHNFAMPRVVQEKEKWQNLVCALNNVRQKGKDPVSVFAWKTFSACGADNPSVHQCLAPSEPHLFRVSGYQRNSNDSIIWRWYGFWIMHETKDLEA